MLPHLKSPILIINTYCLLKINFKVENFLQVSQGLKLALEKVQWKNETIPSKFILHHKAAKAN